LSSRSALLGAAFLMATSAIGPGFLTQTGLFTADLMASFGFVILVSLLLDIGAQLNIWRVITISNLRAQDLANRMVPGLGVLLAGLIGFGGLAFNIGNIGGAGLGLNAMVGLDLHLAAGLSALIALGIFWYGEAGRLIDWLVKILGVLMILLTVVVAITSQPPVGEALYRTVWPERIDGFRIITLVGGTVGGYISFAGAHRLLDGGYGGTHQKAAVNRSAVSGILLTTFMRYILFLAVLGVVSGGATLDPSNPTGSVFRHAAGAIGYRFFGGVMWCASLTSVIGASYTTISFFKTLHPWIERHQKALVSVFILISTALFLLEGNPATLLVAAGALNGLILPLALILILVAARKPAIVGSYRHPLSLQLSGWLVVALMAYFATRSFGENFRRLFD
jgi:Mn2+/Fe2+ NRAMP family transporter